jgi:very-short-patch-repair endonuclease
MVGVEMDGAAYHSLPAHRERDLRRDAMLARLGWLIVRFTHQRLHTDAAGVRQELCAILRMRRRQLGLQPA